MTKRWTQPIPQRRFGRQRAFAEEQERKTIMGSGQSNSRADFTDATKRTLALRAAFRCSNPSCGALTIGPGAGNTDIEMTGTAAHIYAAAPNGPRGTGGLTDAQRRAPLNGIWLCARCARLVDTNAGGAYPLSLLRGWRDLHEARIRMEHGGVSRPFGWIHSIEILDDVWLAEPTTVRFSRCNIFIGDNGMGKTLFLSLLSGLASPSRIMERASRPDSTVHAAINWYDPQPRRAEFRAEGEQLHFSADGTAVPFVPQPYRIVHLAPDSWRDAPRDVRELGNMVGLDHWVVRKLIVEMPEIVGGAVKRAWVEDEEIHAQYVRGSEVVVDRGPHRGLDAIVALEVLVALAETYARTQPTLLLIDALYRGTAAEFDHATELLSSSTRGFQTVATSGRSSPPLSPEWTVTRFVLEADATYIPLKRWARLVQDEA
ncbi:replication initiation negative regulator SeqA [Streptomyces sp. SLBN-115]|uniref:replication initiation negative regulator SeqA n=1 Tax=Streptomyces sp. SLBN-115 TaxID=2768453 RepID=UPI00114D66D0|nr:replication initiation negative regulator SeqA [Streptomyces sp. SLBN-115]